MKLIEYPVTKIFEVAYGQTSTLKHHTTWWGRPIYQASIIFELLAVAPGFKATRYPSGKIWRLKGPELSQADLEAIILSGPKPIPPRLDIVQTLADYYQTALAGLFVASSVGFLAFSLFYN